MKETLDGNVLRDTDRKVWSVMKKGLLGLLAAVMVFGLSTISSFAATGTVTAQTAKIREKASTESSVVASTAKGSKVDIVGAEKDSSGMVWYKVPVAGGSYGYVRSDLIETSDNIEVSSAQPAATQAPAQEKPAATVPTSIGEQQATVKCDTNVKIRSGASTSHDVVTSLPNGTAITLIGEANDAAGNKWYQLRCNYNNKDIEGYIRSDLITIGAPAGSSEEEGQQETETPADGEQPADAETETPEETQEPEQEEVPEEPVEEHNDYEIVYLEDTNSPGEFHYYLYDNLDGTRRDVEELLKAVSVSNENVNILQKEASRTKIIIIVLAVVVVLLFAALTILFIKLRGANEYEYEDYEDEEENEIEEPAPAPRRRRVREEEEYERPVRRERYEEPVRESRPVRERTVERERVQEKAAPVEKPERAPRKAQNFLTDDDEFEFEFLNMDDKDL